MNREILQVTLARAHLTPCVVRIDQSLQSTDLFVPSASGLHTPPTATFVGGPVGPLIRTTLDSSRYLGRSMWRRAVGGARVHQSGTRYPRWVDSRLWSGTRKFCARRRTWIVQHPNSYQLEFYSNNKTLLAAPLTNFTSFTNFTKFPYLIFTPVIWGFKLLLSVSVCSICYIHLLTGSGLLSPRMVLTVVSFWFFIS